MVFLCVGISAAVVLIVGYFQVQQLRFDFRFTEHFVSETTKNALVLEQPIMLQRSISEFWKAFNERDSAITGIEVYFDESLVSQNGLVPGKSSWLRFKSKRCFPSSRQDVCLLYFIDPLRFLSQVFFVLLAVITSAFGVYFLRRRIAERNVAALSHPLELEIARIAAISEGMKTAAVRDAGAETRAGQLPIREVAKLSEAYNDLLKHNREFLNLEKAAAISESLNSLAAQVAHDIRSPLSALNAVMKSIDALPDEQRRIIRNAAGRINDIADGLLTAGKPLRSTSVSTPPAEPVMLSSLLEAIVAEKRVQFGEFHDVEILADLPPGQGLFAAIGSSELSRVVSNLVNNSVEAAVGPTRVTVALVQEDGSCQITVSDTGKGMPPEVLAKIGEKGVTHGKEGTDSGSGIGVYHARETIERAGGKFKVESQVGRGTTITMVLPRTAAPGRFAEREGEPGRAKYDAILIDDDSLVIMTWRITAKRQSKALTCFSSPDEFFAKASSFELSTPLYIDVDLGDGQRGEDAAVKASRLGFTTIYLATGHAANAITKPSCVKAVVGKDPAF